MPGFFVRGFAEPRTLVDRRRGARCRIAPAALRGDSRPIAGRQG